jgi:hypothetical protein
MWAVTLVLLVAGVSAHTTVKARGGRAVIVAALCGYRALWIVAERGAAAAYRG